MAQGRTAVCLIIVSLFVLSLHGGIAYGQSLMEGAERPLGEVSFAVSCGPDVQADFNKGVALLHNMMYMRSEREFQAITQREPDCAMAHWGIAMTLFHPLWAPPSEVELRRGREAARKAAVLNPPTKRERAYIAAVNAFYGDGESIGHPARIAAWEAAQERVHKEYPDDVDAGAFYALSHLATAPKGDATFANQKEAAALLERLREKAPRHPGLFHYTIHACDNPMLAARALEVAKEYDTIAPDAPHAQHMPSHIFVRMGLWDLSSQWNARSAAAAKAQSRAGELSLHYIHAMDYLMYAYLQKAQDDRARATLAEINAVEKYQDSFASAYGIAAAQARYPLERRKWDEAAKLPVRTHGTFPWDNYPWHESITHFARGIGAARNGDSAGAQREVAVLDGLHERTVGAGQDYWAVLVDAQRKTVAAWAAFADGKKDEALEMMRKAADVEDSVDKHPVTPGAVLPARELLGDMLLLLDEPAAALKAYQASLAVSPNRFNSLFGAGLAAERAGDSARAKSYYSALVEMTAGVESDRERLAKARAFLAEK